MADLQASYELAQVAARAAAQKLAKDIVAIDVHEHTIITDVFVIVSADNPMQARAIVNNIDEALSKRGAAPNHKEGADLFNWVLMQAPGIIVHVFLEEERAYYDLERLWREAPKLELPDYSKMTAAELSDGDEDFNPADSAVEEGGESDSSASTVHIVGLD